jgi:hypothetical protein
VNPTVRVASTSYYYPGWSLDSFYYSSGYGYGYGYGGPYFSLSWSSGYYQPWPAWSGLYYDPWWYGAPYRYGWYAPYRHYHNHGYYAWNRPYGHDRYRQPYHSGYRGGRDGYAPQRQSATLDPDWRREDRLRQSWRGEAGEDRNHPTPAPATRSGNTPRLAMPAGSTGSGRGMTVRSRSETKDEITRLHRKVEVQKPTVVPRQRDERRDTRVIPAAPAVVSRSTGEAGLVRSAGQTKAGKTRNTPAPVNLPRDVRLRAAPPAAASQARPPQFTPPPRQGAGNPKPTFSAPPRPSLPDGRAAAPGPAKSSKSENGGRERNPSRGSRDSER